MYSTEKGGSAATVEGSTASDASSNSSGRSARQEDRSADTEKQMRGHLLVADDTPLMQQLVKRMLEKMGFEVSLAKNGVEAVELATTQPFDAIIMDMQMPEMDGMEATRLLREKGYTLPIFALTANVVEKYRVAFYEAGCDGFIGKPIDNNKLKQLLQEYLS